MSLPDWTQIQVESIAQSFVNPIAGLTQSAAWMQLTNLHGSIGTGLSKPEEEWQELDHWTVDLQPSLLSGNPNYGAQIGAVYSPQALFAPVGFWPTLLTLHRRPGKDWWGIEAGILPFEPHFLTAPIIGLYVSDMVAAAPGIPIPSPTTTLRLGSFDLAAVGAVSNSLGIATGILPPGPGWMYMAQAIFKPRWIKRAAGPRSRLAAEAAG